MRPHGRAQISATRPRALGICQRCGFKYNHDRLRWQFQYGAMRLINLRILVCDTCYDTPQIQLRTILLPPDPVPIEYPVPENYSNADSGVGKKFTASSAGITTSDATPAGFATVGFAPSELFTEPGTVADMNIGTMIQAGGLDAAFDGKTNKPSVWSAVQAVSNSSFQNTVGKYWNAVVATNAAQSIQPPVAYNVIGFAVTAPSDQPLLKSGSTGVQFQGSNNGISWTVLYSTTTPGTNGEVITGISSNLSGGNFQYHRVAIQGDGATQVAVAQLSMTVSNTGQNEQ